LKERRERKCRKANLQIFLNVFVGKKKKKGRGGRKTWTFISISMCLSPGWSVCFFQRPQSREKRRKRKGGGKDAI